MDSNPFGDSYSFLVLRTRHNAWNISVIAQYLTTVIVFMDTVEL